MSTLSSEKPAILQITSNVYKYLYISWTHTGSYKNSGYLIVEVLLLYLTVCHSCPLQHLGNFFHCTDTDVRFLLRVFIKHIDRKIYIQLYRYTLQDDTTRCGWNVLFHDKNMGKDWASSNRLTDWKYAYWLSGGELNIQIDATLMAVNQ